MNPAENTLDRLTSLGASRRCARRRSASSGGRRGRGMVRRHDELICGCSLGDEGGRKGKEVEAEEIAIQRNGGHWDMLTPLYPTGSSHLVRKQEKMAFR